MKRKGMFLIYVLFTAVLISVFLITAVQDMQNNIFITQKFACENKAYWAAEAGLQYCEYKLKSDLGWPFVNAKVTDNNKIGTEQFGKFNVTSSLENGDKSYYIHGVSTEDDEEFCIYFTQKSKNSTNLVPSTFPSKPQNLSYCSYNSIADENLDSLMKNNDNITYKDIQFTVSNSPQYKAVIITPGVYIISDGRYRGYRAVIEKMFVADYGNTYGGGIYAGGDIDITLVNQNNSIKVNQISNSRPKVYCKKDIKIERNSEWINAPFSTETSKKFNYLFPFSINDGTIYMNNLPYYFEVKQYVHNGKNHGTDKISNNGNLHKENDTFKQQYGINIEEYTKEDDSLFPKVSWEDIEKIKKQEEKLIDDNKKSLVETVDGGSYIAIFNDQDEKYELAWIPENFLLKNGDPDKEAIERMQKKITEAEENAIKDIVNDSNNYDRNGRFLAQGKLNAATQKLADLVNDSHELIERFVTFSGGEILSYSVSDDGSNSSHLKNNITTNKRNIFSIETVDISTIKQITEEEIPKKDNNRRGEKKDDKITKYTIEYNVTKTPIIKINKSISITDNRDFNLLTLKLQRTSNNSSNNSKITNLNINNGSDPLSGNTKIFDFEVAKDVSTDLVLDKKITGFNESYVLAKGIENETKNNLIAGKDKVNIYSNSSIVINGKLSGKGQIFSKKNLFFRAGTALNTNDYNDITREYNSFTGTYKITDIKEKQNVGEISKIAIYSKGTTVMKAPQGESEEDLDELHNKIRHLLVGESSTGEEKLDKVTGNSIKEIANKILFKNVQLKAQDLTRVASSVNQAGSKPVTSAVIVNDLSEKITLLKLMRKYYGFEEREARNYIEEIVKRNYIYDEEKDSFKMPDNYNDIEIISTRSSSSFSGLIYACGGFSCDAENNNIVINGTIVSYGADPASSSPGSKSGLDDELLLIKDNNDKNVVDFTRRPGTIKITNCKDFSIVYDSTDLATFVYKYSSDKPIHLSNIYCNKL